jgi:type I restriction enzyme S subunit
MIADLKPYGEYKPTDQAWLGEVPRHWSVVPNRALFSEVKERNHPDEEMLSVTITRGIIRQKALLAGSSKKDSSRQDKSAYKLVEPHDIAYNKMRAWQGAIGASDFRGIISPAYVVMRLREDGNLPRYFHYLYRTPQFAKEAERWSYGITSDMWSLRPEHFKMIYTPEPPPAEQAAIVRFLDWANGRLERAIRAKRKVIALLGEQKQAIIHRVVTRGLDPSAPLKPSGIPWLGDIPQHWRTSRLSQLSTRIGDGLHGTPQYVDHSPYYFINGNNLVHGRIRLKPSTRCVSENEFKRYMVELDDSSVLISINGTIGSVAYYRGESIILGKSAAYINCGKDLARPFLFSFLRSSAVINFLRQEVTGTTIFNLSLASIRSLPIALPSVDEQLKIASAIEDMIAPVRTTISRLEREIDLLREYRTRLIADVVTGKLDVREAAARLPEEAPLDTDEDDADLGNEIETLEEEANL